MRNTRQKQSEAVLQREWARSVAAWLRDLAVSQDSGSSLVEMAIVTPMMLLLVTGIFMFGIALNNDLVLTNAVNQGAQLVSVSRGTTSDPCATAVTAVENAAPTLTTTSLSFTVTINGTAHTGTSCTSATLTAGDYITLNVTYPVTVSPFSWSSKTYTLSATTTEIIE